MLQRLIELLKPDVSPDVKIAGVTTFLAKQLEKLDSRLRTQEIRGFQRGEKGEQGKQGTQGERGKDGKDGKNGKDGKDGKDGKAGTKGKDGISVTDAEVDYAGNLVLKLSNGELIDAGEVVQRASGTSVFSQQLANFQITVSATAPATPQVNELWFDIS